MDTVWIRLNVLSTPTTPEFTEVFMFGAGGVVSFTEETSEKTALKRSDGTIAAWVSDSEDTIMSILRKMRQTEGRLNGEQSSKQKEAGSKNKARKTKASR